MSVWVDMWYGVVTRHGPSFTPLDPYITGSVWLGDTPHPTPSTPWHSTLQAGQQGGLNNAPAMGRGIPPEQLLTATKSHLHCILTKKFLAIPLQLQYCTSYSHIYLCVHFYFITFFVQPTNLGTCLWAGKPQVKTCFPMLIFVYMYSMEQLRGESASGAVRGHAFCRCYYIRYISKWLVYDHTKFVVSHWACCGCVTSGDPAYLVAEPSSHYMPWWIQSKAVEHNIRLWSPTLTSTFWPIALDLRWWSCHRWGTTNGWII